ncbi:hypothetical protein Dsin_025076 [Dipteronia sinensis]|uniref:Uncharacterized protein n=1 Tax=Dipteronia sinensis TaxID=43782 RepID=A0AAD9ZVB7_9ROSI|nr:hypothetical protein Dsin_025076 [Dipteronia sinensis]
MPFSWVCNFTCISDRTNVVSSQSIATKVVHNYMTATGQNNCGSIFQDPRFWGRTVGFRRLCLVVSPPLVDFLETVRAAVVQGIHRSLKDDVGCHCRSLLDRLVYVGGGFEIAVAPSNRWRQGGGWPASSGQISVRHLRRRLLLG